MVFDGVRAGGDGHPGCVRQVSDKRPDDMGFIDGVFGGDDGYRVQFPVPQKVFDAIGRKEKEAEKK